MFTTEQLAFINDRARAMRNEVLRAIIFQRPFYEGGPVPTAASITSFGPLHDFCDANTLGGWCDEDGPVAATRYRMFAQDDPDSWFDAAQHAQGMVDDWIRTRGGMDGSIAFLNELLVPEQVDCLLDEARAQEARDMVDDLEHRVGITAEAAKRLRAFLPLQIDEQPAAKLGPDTAEGLLREVRRVYLLCDPDSPEHDAATDLVTELSAVMPRIEAFIVRVEADRADLAAAFSEGLDLETS